ncbi:MAG: hypothetical protein AB7P99_22100, partial [Vicinamibacterales bacterium]
VTKRVAPRTLGEWLNLLTTPVIYALLVPFVFVDVSVRLYEAVCFPIYGIASVQRAAYFVHDRYRLPYLTAVERLNCLYCSYVNGVLGYVQEVASRTELYWCPIKHARSARSPHARYRQFADYGDAMAYHRGLPTFRASLSPRGAHHAGRSLLHPA